MSQVRQTPAARCCFAVAVRHHLSRPGPCCLALAVNLALCPSCASSPQGLKRTVVEGLVVRTTLASVSTLHRPVRWALAMHPTPTSIREVVFSVDGRVVGIARAKPFACCPGRGSYLDGLTPGPHTFVCTVLTTDRRASRETVTATVIANLR
jgi:hypothetical protein